MPQRRNFRNNQRNNNKKKKRGNTPALRGSVNSRYLDRMREEGTTVGSNAWTQQRKIEFEIRRSKAAREKLEKTEDNAKDRVTRVARAPRNW
jgi:hypothetical protein